MDDVVTTLQLGVVVGVCSFALASALGRHAALWDYLARAVKMSVGAVIVALTLGRVQVQSRTRRQVNRTRRRARAFNDKCRIEAGEAPKQARASWTDARHTQPDAASPATTPKLPVRTIEAGVEPPQLPPRIGPPR